MVYRGGMDLEDVALPTLMRMARGRYRADIRAALAEVGCDDVPRNGVFVLGAVAAGGAPLSEIIARLGISKQAAGVLVDTLVARDYVERTVDPDDRRRLRVALTERGAAAAEAVLDAVAGVDAALTARVGREHVAHTRATLIALIRDAGNHA